MTHRMRIEKDVAYLVKNFQKFLKFKNNGKFGDKGKFQSLGREKREFKKKDGKEYQSTQGVTCFECNGHGHFKKECPNYLKSKGKVYATTLSDWIHPTLFLRKAVTKKGITLLL